MNLRCTGKARGEFLFAGRRSRDKGASHVTVVRFGIDTGVDMHPGANVGAVERSSTANPVPQDYADTRGDFLKTITGGARMIDSRGRRARLEYSVCIQVRVSSPSAANGMVVGERFRVKPPKNIHRS